MSVVLTAASCSGHPAGVQGSKSFYDDGHDVKGSEQLFRYVEQQWLSKASIGPSRLSVRDNNSHTNNAVDSFQAALRGRVKAGPVLRRAAGRCSPVKSLAPCGP